jgi:hypothetical protein
MCTLSVKVLLIAAWRNLRDAIDSTKMAQKELARRGSTNTLATKMSYTLEVLQSDLNAVERELAPFIADMPVEEYIEQTYRQPIRSVKSGPFTTCSCPSSEPMCKPNPMAVPKHIQEQRLDWCDKELGNACQFMRDVRLVANRDLSGSSNIMRLIGEMDQGIQCVDHAFNAILNERFFLKGGAK